MHRSGTSALAGVLHKNKICMGREDDFYPPAMKENPRGFYENVRFRRVNDAILKENDYRVKSFHPTIPIVHNPNGGLRTIMKDIIKYYDEEFEDWGFKDPRTCLTLCAWKDVLEELGLLSKVKIVVMLRDASSIADSMRRRGNKENFRGQFTSLVAAYLCHMYEHLSYIPEVPKVFLRFEDLLYKPSSCVSTLSVVFEKEMTDTSFIDPAISKGG